MDDFRKELKNLVITGLKLQDEFSADDIADEAPFLQDLGLDSLDVVELVVLIKKKYGVLIKDVNDGQEAFQSIDALVKFIEERQNL